MDRKIRVLSGIFMVMLLSSGCASRYLVKEARDEKFVNSLTMSCKKPYLLEQDCSSWTGAKRVIDINGNKLKIAGTADGKVILIMDKSPIKSAFKAGFSSPIYDSYSKGNSDNFQVIKYELQNHGIEIVDVRPIGALGSLDGYIIILNSDGYSVLKEYSVKK